ncbi:hypothetical protein Q9295_08355 [Xinfangfangia sp. CPCC 101601]|uniref:DUF2125 domain-containing protein n=1 Tax=Pseudogemmobacter lacusdianii TaxID=3069608 RepID=A0ABU0VX95_9RHOB|nr:hypothetical protein [Xinfangfangia sp. CPCC 101601]MDQ2066382.1 hypothetical protein [Xinfangfangia sp. CPCC 101601]
MQSRPTFRQISLTGARVTRPAWALPAAALALLAQPLQADTTPEAVWQLIQEEAGPVLTAQESRRGSDLVLSHPRLALPDGAWLALPNITLRQQSDGAVTLELPPNFPVELQGLTGPDAPEKVTLTITAPDLQAVFRDIDAEDIDVAISAGSLSAVMEPITQATGWNGKNTLVAALTLDDLSFAWLSQLPPEPELNAKGAGADAHLSLGNLSLDARAVIPSEGVEGQVSLNLSELSLALEALFPPGGIALMESADAPDLQKLPQFLAMLEQGLRLHLRYQMGPVQLAIDMPELPEGPFAMDLSMAGSDAEFSLDRNGLVYDKGAEGTAFSFQGQLTDMPLDNLSLSIAEMRETVRLGLPSAGGASDWALLYKFAGIDVSETIWDIFDPARQLPRDPLSLVLDLTGTWTPDPRLLSGSPSAHDLPLTALTAQLNEALVAGAGVSFSGEGALDFDFTDRSRYIDDLPVPEGALSFLTKGANALLDNLVALGAISPDELTGARFALMFAGKALSDDPDVLTTELEFKDGSIVLNGMKIR